MNKFRGECEIVVDNKNVYLLFSLYTFMLFSEEMGVDLDEMNKALGKSRGMSVLVWCAMEAGFKERKEKNPYSVIDTADILSTLTAEDQIKIGKTIEAVLLSSDETDNNGKKK